MGFHTMKTWSRLFLCDEIWSCQVLFQLLIQGTTWLFKYFCQLCLWHSYSQGIIQRMRQVKIYASIAQLFLTKTCQFFLWAPWYRLGGEVSLIWDWPVPCVVCQKQLSTLSYIFQSVIFRSQTWFVFYCQVQL